MGITSGLESEGAALSRICSNGTIRCDDEAGWVPEQSTHRNDGASPSMGRKMRDRCPSVISALVALSFKMYCSLSAFVWGFTTRKTPPARRVPKMETTASQVLSI